MESKPKQADFEKGFPSRRHGWQKYELLGWCGFQYQGTMEPAQQRELYLQQNTAMVVKALWYHHKDRHREQNGTESPEIRNWFLYNKAAQLEKIDSSTNYIWITGNIQKNEAEPQPHTTHKNELKSTPKI